MQSCPAGNPIDVYSGRKFEFKVDYVSPNGALKVARRYVDQNSGWIINAEPRLKYVGAGEAVLTEGLFNQTRKACVAPVEQLLTRYKATYDEPFVMENYTELVCPKLLNRETTPVIYAWLNGQEYRFIDNGGVYRPEGGFEGRLKIEPVSDASVPNAVWKLTQRDGARSYFDNEGVILKTFLATGGFVTYHYLNGQLVSKADQSGRFLAYVHNDQQRLESVTLPDGGVIRYDYLNNDNERDVNYWLLAQVTWPDGASEGYAYNEPEHILGTGLESFLTGKIDAYGQRTGTYKYSVGKATSTEGFGGADKVEVTYRGYSYIQLKDGLGTERTFYFQTQLADGKRLLTREWQPAGAGSAAANEYRYYNSDGQVTEKRDFNGNKIQTAYDPILKFETVKVEGIPASQWGTYTTPGAVLPAGARKTSTEWDATLSRPTRIAAPGKLTTRVYQGLPDPFDNNAVANCSAASLGSDPLPVVCRVVEQATTDANGQLGFAAGLDPGVAARHVLYTYNDNGDVLTVRRSPDFSLERSLAYYADTTATHRIGDLQSVQNALGHRVDYLEYDAHGNPTKIQDANGVLTLLSYDARGRLTSQTVAGQTTTLAYDLNGRLASVTAPDGTTLTQAYDGAGRLSAVIDGLLNRLEYSYDLEGNRLSSRIVDASGATVFSSQHEYDALSRRHKTLGNNGQISTITYDAEGNPLTDTDALTNTTTASFDALNRVSTVVDPDAGETAYAYDGQGRLTQVTDAEGKVTQYDYDAFGNVTTLTSPDTGVTSFTYDNAGNVLTKTDARGITVTYGYDALNRLTTQTYPDASENITYHYDDTTNGNQGIGRLTQVTDPSGSTAYVYDSRGNVTRETRVIDGHSYTTDYHFDANGRLTGITYPSGRELSYAFDALGRISGLTSNYQGQPQVIASTITYLPFGPVSGLTYGNNKTLTQSYDTDYRLTDKADSGIDALSYGYDLTDNITTLLDALATAENQSFTYDQLSRLLTGTGSYGDLGFSYDKIGNRLTRTENTATDTYRYADGTHRLADISGAHPSIFTHDAAGNTRTKGDLSFSYNQQGRLQTATKTGMSATYRYNFKGERSSKTVNGVTTHYLYDGQGQLIAEADGNGAIQREYLYLETQRLAIAEAGSLYYIHTNHLDTPVAMTDETGTRVWSATYTPFGQATLDEDPDGDGTPVTLNLRFPGQYYDVETGLIYNYFRYLDPQSGRYLTSDPIGLAGGLNTYTYVENNPVSKVDFYGLTGTIVSPRPLLGPLNEPIIRPFPADPALPFPDLFRPDLTDEEKEFCRKERQACAEECADAQDNFNEPNVFGGSIANCIKGCLPAKCGGNRPDDDFVDNGSNICRLQ